MLKYGYVHTTSLTHTVIKYSIQIKSESTYKPGPVKDSHSSRTCIATSLKQPTRVQREQRLFPKGIEHLFGLAPSGVYLAVRVTTNAVRSYRTISPLLNPGLKATRSQLSGQALPLSWSFAVIKKGIAVSFCCTGRRLTPPRRYLALCSSEPGLSSPSYEAATAQLTQRAVYLKSPLIAKLAPLDYLLRNSFKAVLKSL